jgi:putative oxidoreductase
VGLGDPFGAEPRTGGAIHFEAMRRLFSSFAHGVPALGLMLLRVTVGIALIAHSVPPLLSGHPLAIATLYALLALSGLLLLVGLWTPVAGALVAPEVLGAALAHLAPWPQGLFIVVMALALALLGPGAWSIDAWLYGWKQIRINGNRRRGPPS